MEVKRQHFILVHGGGHGAWCWWKLVPLLEQSGHRVTAVDLASGGETASEIAADDIETFEQYNRPLQQLFKSLPHGEKVILVGHSMGGINVSYMAENYSNQIAVSVYIAAFMLPSDMGTLEAGVSGLDPETHGNLNGLKRGCLMPHASCVDSSLRAGRTLSNLEWKSRYSTLSQSYMYGHQFMTNSCMSAMITGSVSVRTATLRISSREALVRAFPNPACTAKTLSKLT